MSYFHEDIPASNCQYYKYDDDFIDDDDDDILEFDYTYEYILSLIHI